MKKLALSTLLLALASASLWAGPYSNATTGTSFDSTAVKEWATGVSVTRGPADIEDPTGATATFGALSNALGAADAQIGSHNVVSLGDGGSAILTFALPIGNGTGADFSVFENGFADLADPTLSFLELAFVSVSSDGTNYFTFPSVSLTQSNTQTGAFDWTDATNINGLAGKTLAGIGTDFDLQTLAGVSPLLNINDVKYVKVTDVVGDINPAFATRDSLGNIINDPYPTVFDTGGFDLDAVAVMNLATVPEPGTWMMLFLGVIAIVAWRKRFAMRALVMGSVVLSAGFANAQLVDFSSLTPSTPYAGPGGGAYTNTTTFSVGGLGFNNSFTQGQGFSFWSGFAYSNTTDQTTPGFTNQYSAATAGKSGITTYAVGFVDGFTPDDPTITLPTGFRPLALTITNSVYAELSMENGDQFAKKFSYADKDFFVLDITGLNSAGQSTGEVQFYLADFRTSASPGIVTDWTNVDLSSLGAGTTALDFTEASSDNGDFGMNTPAYFDLGSVTLAADAVPEPSTYALLLAGFALLAVYKKKQVTRVKAGFTLVEVLVVVAITAILLALTSGIYTWSINQARTVNSISILRQLCIANIAYAGDHDGAYCPAQDQTNNIRWHGARTSSTGTFDTTQGYLSPYLGSNLVVHDSLLRNYDVITGINSWEDGSGGFGYNEIYIGGTPQDPYHGALSFNVKHPERTVMFGTTAFAMGGNQLQEYPFCEPPQWVNSNNQLAGSLQPSLQFRANGKALVGWCDGHVTAEKPNTTTGPNYYGGSNSKVQIGWFGPTDNNGYWNPDYARP